MTKRIRHEFKISNYLVLNVRGHGIQIIISSVVQYILVLARRWTLKSCIIRIQNEFISQPREMRRGRTFQFMLR